VDEDLGGEVRTGGGRGAFDLVGRRRGERGVKGGVDIMGAFLYCFF